MLEQQHYEHLLRQLQYMEFILLAAALIGVYFAVRAHLIGNQLTRFARDFEAQLSGFLDSHAKWSDVANIAVKQAPDTLESLLRLLLSLQELTHQISRAGGLSRLFSDFAAKPTAPKRQATQDSTGAPAKRGRKPRVSPVQPSNNGTPIEPNAEQTNLEEYDN